MIDYSSLLKLRGNCLSDPAGVAYQLDVLFDTLPNVSSNKANHQCIVFGQDYEYSNRKVFANASNSLVDDLLQKLSKHANTEYNQLFINRFDSTGIGAHRDNEALYVDPATGEIDSIAVLSLGASSVVSITGEHNVNINATDNTVYVMPAGRFQFNNTHKVGACNGVRFSVTARRVVNPVPTRAQTFLASINASEYENVDLEFVGNAVFVGDVQITSKSSLFAAVYC